MRHLQLVAFVCADMNTPNPLPMSPELVIAAVATAVAMSRRSLTDREQFARACLPLPLPGLVKVDDFHAGNLGVASGDHRVWFVTQEDPQSVFFDEACGLFGSCWGPDQEKGTYDDLGYRSEDPIEMYFV